MQFKSYRVNIKHRKDKATHDASMWSVSEWVEIQLFTEASRRDWKSSGKSLLWAIQSESYKLSQIGFDLESKLYVAKFRCDENQEWHGYPVFPRGDDIPPESVLESWRSEALIDKTTKRRIQKGKFDQ